MNKNAHFGNLTPRMQQFREELLECRPYICAERAVLATQSYKEHADKPITLKRAYTLANILQNMTIFIEQLIAAGVDPRTAEADACRIEHIISDESFSRLKEAAEQEQT